MIPKIIHYCWFGRGEKPAAVLRCIDSWHRYCPGYQIKEWNEDNFDVDALDYTRQAYANKKYAFVSDVARLSALVTEGGIYCDTDVELVGSFDEMTGQDDAFVGFEGTQWIATGTMACAPNHPIFVRFLAMYQDEQFLNADSTLNMKTNVQRLTQLMVSEGLKLDGAEQYVGGCHIYPTDVLSPYDYIDGRLTKTERTRAIHWYGVSWIGRTPLKKKLSQFYHRLRGIKRL